MERDIHKFADWLVERTQAGVAIEHKILEWKTAEKEKELKPISAEEPSPKGS